MRISKSQSFFLTVPFLTVDATEALRSTNFTQWFKIEVKTPMICGCTLF